MPSSKPESAGYDAEKLSKSLLSIGVDKESVDALISSRELDRAIVPIYWKDGIVPNVSSLWLPKLPEFLWTFTREFPDGQVRWDKNFEGGKPEDGDVAIRVFFDYQEDDQGDRWAPKPTPNEEESYYRLLKLHSYKGTKPAAVYRIIRG